MSEITKALAAAKASELAPVLSRTASSDSEAFDISEYEGLIGVVLAAGAATAGTNPTLDVKITHCAAADGTPADVDDAAFEQVTDEAGVQMLLLDKNKLHKYIFADWTIGGTNSPAFPFGLAVAGVPKYGV